MDSQGVLITLLVIFVLIFVGRRLVRAAKRNGAGINRQNGRTHPMNRQNKFPA